jgi:hypothetical protein
MLTVESFLTTLLKERGWTKKKPVNFSSKYSPVLNTYTRIKYVTEI